MKRIAATFAGVLGAILAQTVLANTYTVNYLADYADPNPGDGICAGNGNTNFCTLRAAIQTANAHAGPDVIVVPGGTYVLSLHGAGEDSAATGDLDITDSVTIQAQTAGVLPVIDGDGADRIFDIKQESLSSYDVTLNGLHLTNGLAGPAGVVDDELGGAIRAGTNGGPSFLNNFNVLFCIIDNSIATAGGGMFVNGANIVNMQYLLMFNNRSRNLSPGSGSTIASAMYLLTSNIVMAHAAVVRNLPDDTGSGGATYSAYVLGAVSSFVEDSTFDNPQLGGLQISSQDSYLNNVTVVDNRMLTGVSVRGRGSSYSSTLKIRNSIIAGNGTDCAVSQTNGTVTVDVAGPNADSDGSCGFQAAGGGMPSVSMAALRLAPLGNYGLLPSRTPMPGSVAIDAGSTAAVNSGDPSCGQVDQNGVTRPIDGDGSGTATCDLGAVEYAGDLIFVDDFEVQ